MKSKFSFAAWEKSLLRSRKNEKEKNEEKQGRIN